MFTCPCGLLLLLLQPREGLLKNLFVKRLNCFGGKETSVTERRRERERVLEVFERRGREEGRKEGLWRRSRMDGGVTVFVQSEVSGAAVRTRRRL